MRRIIAFFLAMVLLSGCKPWISIWVSTPTYFPTSTMLQPPTPEPTPTFDPALCLFVEDFRPLNDLTVTFFDLFDQAGFRDFEIQAEAYGQVCLDENKEARGFLPRQTNIRFSSSISSLENLEMVGNKLQEILEVINSIPQEELPGPDIGNLAITFSAAGTETRFSFSLDLGRRAYQQGLSGGKLVEVLK